MYEEGDIADGPNGQQLVFRGGQWVPMTAGPAPVTLGSVDPTAQYAAPKAALDLDEARRRAAAAASAAPVDLALKQAQLQNTLNPKSAPPSGYRFKANGDLEPIPGGPIVGQNGVKKGTGTLDAIVAQINDYSQKYGAGAGATSGLSSVLDYLPSSSNSSLDKSASLLEEIATSAFKVPGMGGQSDADAARLAAAYKPSRYDLDSGTRTTLEGLRRRVDFARKAAGLPKAQWSGDAPKYEAASGASRTERDPRVEAVVNAMLRSGASDDQINAAIQPLGADPVQPSQTKAARDYLKANPGYKGGFSEATKQVPNSLREQASGSAVGAFIGSGVNDALAGIPAAAMGNQQVLNAQKAAHPDASLYGTLAGGVAGAAGLELGLGAGAARLGGGALARVLASPRTADALYGGIQGGVSDGDANGAVTGALAGLAGGVIGRGAARGAGMAFRGVTSQPVRYLRDQGVELTAGQTLGDSGRIGAAIKGVEDRLTGIPVVGDMVNARRLEGFRSFNQAAFDQGLAPIGANTGGVVGEAGVDLARTARSQAYRSALDPVRVNADAPFVADYGGAVQAGQQLPADLGARADYTLRRGFENFTPAGELDGNGFQQGIRRFRREAAANAPLPNGHDFGEVMQQGEGAFEGLLQRQSPGTLPAYNAANTANRNVEVLRDAVNRGRNGSRVGEAGLFAPSQLADAGAANARKFGNSAGTTNQPFFDLSRAGQTVLPSKVADSGTAGRLALLALPGALGGGYAGSDSLSGAATGASAGATASTLGIGGLLALGATKTGQKALTAALLKRPAAARKLGNALVDQRRLLGMFGAGIGATLPTALAPPSY